MSDFFNEALKGGLDSLTADQLDELIIMAQAKRSESKGKKEIKTSDSCPFCGSIRIKKRGIFEKAWSMDEGTTIPSASPTFSRVSNIAKARSESRNTTSLDRRNRFLRNGRMAWTRMTPIPFSLKSTAAIPKNPTADSSKNSSSQVISFRAFCSGVFVPSTAGV